MTIVEAKVSGGLGNQMFIAAAAKTLATRLNARICFDLSAYSEKSARDFELSYFNLDYEVTQHPFEDQSVTKKVLKKIGKMKSTQEGLPLFTEASFDFDPRFLEIEASVRLQGYFQSWKYFQNITEDISQMFSFPADNKVLEVINRNVGRDFISIHIRRGDYLNPSTREFHGLASDEYFKNALSLIKSNLAQDLPVVIFTDSHERLSEKLTQISDFVVYPEPDIHSGLYMGAMSQAKSFVISNSSFSWWAAFLNVHPHKLVVAPRPWFAKSDVSASDLLPSNWITLGSR